jgi:bacterioferritin
MLRGQEIVKKREDIIKALNRALGAEGLAAYRYLYLSHWVTGHGGHEAMEIFTKMAQEEWTHVGRLLERIVQLGGMPVISPTEWERHSYEKYKAPPKDGSKLSQILEDSLDAERAAISFYQELAQKTQHEDFVTFKLISEILADEVEDEHTLDSFYR